MDNQDEDSSKGFLITCDKNKEKLAIKDAFNFLSEYIEHIYGDLENAFIHQQLAKESKQINLKNEIQARGKYKFKILSSTDTNVNCVVFIKINPKLKQINPNAVVLEIMKDVHRDEKILTRFCHKISPVEKSFKAEHFRMLDQIDVLFQSRDNSEVKSWALNFKCRNNSKFNYKEVLAQTQKIAKKYGHFVDIYYPQWTVNVEIVNHLMCLSIVQDYKQFLEYRLHKKMPNTNSIIAQNNPSGKQKKDKRQKDHEKKERKVDNRQRQEKEKEKDNEKGEQKQEIEKKDNTKLLQQKIQIDQEDQIDFV